MTPDDLARRFGRHELGPGNGDDGPNLSEVLSTGHAADGFTGPELFSEDELAQVADGGPFRARARLIGRMRVVFEGLRHRLARHLEAGRYLAPANADWRHGRIGRGEYLGDMPYTYLDIPRHFEAESAFTFRTLFWWGHGVSFSLILGGQHLQEYRARLVRNLAVLSALEVHIAAGESPWDWERGPGHTLRLATGQESELLRLFRTQTFLKCARFLDFDEPEFRRSRIEDAALLTFQALEPIILA
ncbi:MAG: hypothetical protein IT349_05270 [Candidatus Eisenbacteria bacterium]|nr:hypothetical protein [Candidatus Eisenbacteria bacterium]